jgi:hypothetical protein
LESIASLWNQDTPIETVFANGTECHKFAAEGQDPISDATYIRILLKVFRASGVLDRAIADWERKPEAEHTVSNALAHFKRENMHRLEEHKHLKATLQVNTTITTEGDTTLPAWTTSTRLSLSLGGATAGPTGWAIIPATAIPDQLLGITMTPP